MKFAIPSLTQSSYIPQISWGYGLTPCRREKTYSILAVARGKVLQLFILMDANCSSSTGILYPEGYYISDTPIESMFWLSESILWILTSKKETRILYTP
jgi:hypothetical protein